MADVEREDEAVSDADKAEVRPGVSGSWWSSLRLESILDGEIWYVESIFVSMMMCRKREKTGGLISKGSRQQLVVGVLRPYLRRKTSPTFSPSLLSLQTK